MAIRTWCCRPSCRRRARARAYAAYNAAAIAPERLAGMRFDVEPYLLPENLLPAAARDARYLDLARALQAAASPPTQSALRLEFVVPFWWSAKRELLAALAVHADALTVMNCRTDPAQVEAFATPFLDWAAAHGRQVRIALEAGPIAAQTQRSYLPARAGEAADRLALELAGRSVLVPLERPLAVPAQAPLSACCPGSKPGSAPGTASAGSPCTSCADLRSTVLARTPTRVFTHLYPF